MSPERPSAGWGKTAALTPPLSSCKQSPATTVSTGWKRKSPRSQRRPPAWSSSSNTRATTELHPARATRLVHHLTEGLWPVAYAPLNVGGANDVATLKLDARPSGGTSSDGVASAKNSYRETSNPRCFHQAGIRRDWSASVQRPRSSWVDMRLQRYSTLAAKSPRSQRRWQQPTCRTAHCSKPF